MSYYTGVGSRDTPPPVLELMTRIALRLAHDGYTLRSGGAFGADLAFEQGATLKEIFLAHDATPAAMNVAAALHPAWDRCSPFARRLHGRNAFQVLGATLNSPSDFLVCWTADGCIHHNTRTINTGGTGTAISIASTNGVPVHNLSLPTHLNTWLEWLT